MPGEEEATGETPMIDPLPPTLDVTRLDGLIGRLYRIQREGGITVHNAEFRDHYEVSLFPPATAQQIQNVELALGKRLPADFTYFWRATNGANLFVNDSALHGVGVASTEMMSELEQDEAEIYGRGSLRRHAVFARVNGAGDFLAFDLATGAVVDGIHAEQPDEWRVIADSFTDWLERLVDGYGRYYWLESLYSAPSDQIT
jgi:hypothetical protein